ncbi:MAG: YegS/Rv2252/BmrU family lipid kinase [Paludibacteraceae bacterium]|nr:YegS/Rv2252/BmrU family lipid kinase [Paludibacteraceae bacterium]
MLGIVINPKSGKRVFRLQRVYLWRLLRNLHEPFTYRVTKYADHATELGRELAEKGCNQILVLGGDGTLSEVVNGIMQADIPESQRKNIQFGIMPRGTGNDWARFWGLDKDYQRSLELFFNGKSQSVDVGCLTYYRNGVEYKRYFINSIGFGVDSLTCVYAAKLKPYIGAHHINYFIGFFIALAKLKTVYMQLIADGKEVANQKLFHMNIANGPYNGGGMKQNADADPRDGIFHGLFVESPTFKQVLKGATKLFNGGLMNLDFVYQFSGTEMNINTKKHLKLELDGILMDIVGSCKVTCLHHALNMTVPQYCEEGKEIHDFNE